MIDKRLEILYKQYSLLSDNFNKKKLSRKERTRKLIQKGALIEMTSLLEVNEAIIVGLLLEYYLLDEDKKREKEIFGYKFFEKRKALKKASEV